MLTKREREVGYWIGKGLTNKEIAQVLVVETSTVKKHIENALDKLGCCNRAELAVRIRQMAN